jgi:hypothetical protein
MQLHHWALAVALAAIQRAAAAAQAEAPPSQPPGRPGQPERPPVVPAPPAQESEEDGGWLAGQWFGSGFVGGDFGAIADPVPGVAEEATADFGASVGFTWNRTVGAEFLAGFTPNFNLNRTRWRRCCSRDSISGEPTSASRFAGSGRQGAAGGGTALLPAAGSRFNKFKVRSSKFKVQSSSNGEPCTPHSHGPRLTQRTLKCKVITRVDSPWRLSVPAIPTRSAPKS